ncbi:hypothetical protein BKA69DRAFT_386961 [Paraphysoderma sedebokerense]|nr:hypothetical protein BKA69DRAFT_386961 [Paraphysoderma sedebokerense]
MARRKSQRNSHSQRGRSESPVRRSRTRTQSTRENESPARNLRLVKSNDATPAKPRQNLTAKSTNASQASSATRKAQNKHGMDIDGTLTTPTNNIRRSVRTSSAMAKSKLRLFNEETHSGDESEEYEEDSLESESDPESEGAAEDEEDDNLEGQSNDSEDECITRSKRRRPKDQKVNPKSKRPKRALNGKKISPSRSKRSAAVLRT